MNVVVIQGKENTIRIRSDGLYGDSLWFSVIYYQYFSREVFYLSFSCKSISSLKTNTQGPDCISILIEKATCCFLSVFLFFFLFLTVISTLIVLVFFYPPSCRMLLFFSWLKETEKWINIFSKAPTIEKHTHTHFFFFLSSCQGWKIKEFNNIYIKNQKKKSLIS